MGDGKRNKEKISAKFIQPMVGSSSTSEHLVKFGRRKSQPPTAIAQLGQLLICWLDTKENEFVLVDSLRQGPEIRRKPGASHRRRGSLDHGIPWTSQRAGAHFARAALSRQGSVCLHHLAAAPDGQSVDRFTMNPNGTLTARGFLRRHGLIRERLRTKLVSIRKHGSLCGRSAKFISRSEHGSRSPAAPSGLLRAKYAPAEKPTNRPQHRLHPRRQRMAQGPWGVRSAWRRLTLTTSCACFPKRRAGARVGISNDAMSL